MGVTFHRCCTHIHCVFAPTVPWLDKYYMRSLIMFLHRYCVIESNFFFKYLTSLLAFFSIHLNAKYETKLDVIINDRSKFQPITRNPTATLKIEVNKLIAAVKKNQPSKILTPTVGEFSPGYLYGTVKTHGANNPLRPISQVTTPPTILLSNSTISSPLTSQPNIKSTPLMTSYPYCTLSVPVVSLRPSIETHYLRTSRHRNCRYNLSQRLPTSNSAPSPIPHELTQETAFGLHPQVPFPAH